jgi:integrase
MGIFARGTRLWARYKDEKGQWVNERTGYAVGQEDKAQRYLARIVGLARDAREGAKASAPTSPTSITVKDYVERWLEDRKALSLASWSDDANRLRKHVVPLIGKITLAAVRPSDVRDVVVFHRKANQLAPRTIRHVFATMAIMFGDAIADELIATTPCVLRKGVLPKKVDKDPDWRATAIYDRSEIQALLFDTRVLQDRRVLYALKALAGLRHSEAARLRWSHFNEDLEPLTGLNLGKTKTGVPRSIPVHPTLHTVLTEWKDAGWERIFGRPPTANDFIVPTRNMTTRESPDAQKALHDDLALLELRPRRGHDLRRTFITLAQVDGARKDILEAISHGPRGDIVSVYTTFPWPVLCAEVAKLKIEPAVVRIPRGLADKTRYTAVTGEQSSRNRWTKTATPAGFEPAFRAVTRSPLRGA